MWSVWRSGALIFQQLVLYRSCSGAERTTNVLSHKQKGNASTIGVKLSCGGPLPLKGGPAAIAALFRCEHECCVTVHDIDFSHRQHASTINDVVRVPLV